MIDIHCHILPGIDDGPQTIAQSLSIARALAAEGYHHVIATPHSRDGIFNAEPETIYAKTKQLNQALLDTGIDLTVYPGAEYPLIPDLLVGQLVTLNRTRYLLIELPFTQPIPQYAEDILFQLKAKGLIPILAHPARCLGIREDTGLVEKYFAQGILIQVNTASFLGHYGKRVQYLAEKLIRQGLVHFIATDSHNPLQYDLGSLIRRLGKSCWDRLTSTNPMVVLRDSDEAIIPAQAEPGASFLSTLGAIIFQNRFS